MFKPIRIIASLVFVASIVLVLIGAFVLGNGVCYFDLSISTYYMSDTVFFDPLDSMFE